MRWLNIESIPRISDDALARLLAKPVDPDEEIPSFSGYGPRSSKAPPETRGKQRQIMQDMCAWGRSYGAILRVFDDRFPSMTPTDIRALWRTTRDTATAIRVEAATKILPEVSGLLGSLIQDATDNPPDDDMERLCELETLSWLIDSCDPIDWESSRDINGSLPPAPELELDTADLDLDTAELGVDTADLNLDIDPTITYGKDLDAQGVTDPYLREAIARTLAAQAAEREAK